MTSPRPILGVLVVGVGGQGVITAARIVGEAALSVGLPVRLGQIHGMSQRGGSVESTVVIGPGLSPFLPLRGADVILAMEPLELQRTRQRLHEGTCAVVSRGRIMPTPMARQGVEYPDPAGIFALIRPLVDDLAVVDGPSIAAGIGAERALSAAMLGVLAARAWLPFDGDVLLDQLERRSPREHIESNRLAFQAGREAVLQ